jgi:Fe-S cluster biogenesis protein NfuA
MAASVPGMADRVEELLAGFDAAQTPHRARERAEELVRTIVGFYGQGLERVLSIVHEQLGDRSEAMFDTLCEDKLVESLLCLHGLHPIALEERIEAAMQSVLPYIKSHKGDMKISRIEGDVVYLRLEGSCDGCPASADTMKLAVERAILERVPEIREVRAEATTTPMKASPPPEYIADTTLRILSTA